MGEGRETWTWGEAFELDLPVDWEVRRAGDAVEICPVGGAGGIQLATLDAPLGETPSAVVLGLVQRFAAVRGASGPHPTSVERDPTGVTRGRVSFAADDGHWLACAAAWHGRVVFLTAYARAIDARMLHVAQDLFREMRPIDLTAPGDLPPDVAGDF